MFPIGVIERFKYLGNNFNYQKYQGFLVFDLSIGEKGYVAKEK
jgi:hypothetical protein